MRFWPGVKNLEARLYAELVIIEAISSGVVHHLLFHAVALMTDIHQCNED